VVLLGLPSVGKSSLLSAITKTSSEAGSYEFTTLTCIPGKIEYHGASIQLLDLPGIIEGAAQGKGRGRQVVAVCKTADLILMMLDATKGDYQKRLLENEIESVGLRLNKKKPDIYFKKKTGGGMKINATVQMTHLTEKLIQSVLQDYKIYNAEVLVREDCTVDEFIDVILGNRKYVPCLYCYNKIDAISIERVEELASRPFSTVISVEYKLGLEMLIDQIWEMLGMLRIYTKKRGEFPDLSGGVVVRNGATIEHVCHAIHRNLVKDFKYALVWGRSAKHQPQKVGITHSLDDEDVVQILKK
jgi:hypothetical protein